MRPMSSDASTSDRPTPREVGRAQKRIVFCTFGSLGDIYPVLALAREMKRRGHSPLITTTECYHQLVESQGVAFYPIRPNVDVSDPAILRRAMDRRNGARYIFGEIVLPNLRETYEDTARAAEDADMIVTHPVTLAALLLARKNTIPWASVALSPVSLFSAYDPPVFTGIPFAEKLATFGPSFQRIFLKTVTFLLEPLWKPFRVLEKELGLSPIPNPLIWPPPSNLVLGLFSPVLGEPQRDWPANAYATGFPFFQQDENISPELQHFLDSAMRPSFSHLDQRQWGPQVIFSNKVRRPQTNLAAALCSWLVAMRAISLSANSRLV